MTWDDDTLCQVVDRSMTRHLRWSGDGPGRRDTLWTPFHHAHVDDTQLLLAPRLRIDHSRRSRWLPEIMELARDRACTTIRCLTTDRLTPAPHERALLDEGFTVEASGHVVGAALSSLELRTPQRLVEVTATPKSLTAALRVSSALWGTPSMDHEEVAAISEALAEVPLPERRRHDVVVWLNQQPAAIGRLMVDGGVATLQEGATLPELRHLGAYTAAVDGRLALARNIGCDRVLAHVEDAFAEKVLTSRGLDPIDATRLYTLTL